MLSHIEVVRLGSRSVGIVVVLVHGDGTGNLLPRGLVDLPLDGRVEANILFVWRRQANDKLNEQAGILVEVEERGAINAAVVVVYEAELFFCNNERASEMTVRLLEENLPLESLSKTRWTGAQSGAYRL